MFRLSLISSAGAWLALLRDVDDVTDDPNTHIVLQNVTVEKLQNVTVEYNRTLVGKADTEDEAKANIGLRCCSQDGKRCSSYLNGDGMQDLDRVDAWKAFKYCNENENATSMNDTAVTFADAEAFCASVNQTLCSTDMLSTRVVGDCVKNGGVTSCDGCWGSGCWHNGRSMWASD